MNTLQNKVAIVTGAASGIGRAIALLFAAEGCKVVAADIHSQRLAELQNDARLEGGELTTVVANMAMESDIEKMIQVAKDSYGKLDILVNNAGIMDHFALVADVDNEMWQRVMTINVDGPFKAMRSACKLFLAQGSGNIINIASVGGITGSKAGAAYTASKYAIVGLSKNTGYMYAKSGIRCNVIAPGGVNTNIGETIDYSKITPLVNDRIMAAMPLNPRMGEPTEIANAALFLASDASSFVNATVLVVDGGWTA